MTSSIPTLRRNVKNVAYNYSDAQVKVREATSNDPWGPSSSLMSEVADLTYNAMAFSDIMQMIWKRLNDHGKNWRHVYKSLVLLDYMIKTGSEKVAQQCKENIYAIQTLKDFQHIEDNKDQGMNVREKAKQLVALLKDEERLKNERTRALMAKKRFAQNSMGISSDGSTHRMNRPRDLQRTDFDTGASMDSGFGGAAERSRRDSELEEARPTSSGEEELQLQIALALSKEEAAKEEEARKGDDVRLQLAISQSQTEKKHHNNSPRDSASGGGTSAQSSGLDELLSLNPPPPSRSHPPPAQTDPWGAPAPVGATGGVPFDPWAPVNASSPPPEQNDPWGGPPSYAAATGTASPPQQRNDPWLPASNSTGSPIQRDPFAPLPPTQQNGTGQIDDVWNMDPLNAGLPPSDGGMGGSRKNVKTPENFLGENSALVNLDNLMGPSKPAVPGMPPSSQSTQNPFLTATNGPSQPSNPFLAQQRPSPTINEMRAQQTQQQTGPTGDWGLPQPLQPQKGATGPSTNPFL